MRCSIADEGVSRARADFLKKLLELNGYVVRIEEVPPAGPEGQSTFMVGVTDMIFNPVIFVYQRLLRTADGRKVTPDYWNQKTEKLEPNYWDRKKKE